MGKLGSSLHYYTNISRRYSSELRLTLFARLKRAGSYSASNMYLRPLFATTSSNKGLTLEIDGCPESFQSRRIEKNNPVPEGPSSLGETYLESFPVDSARHPLDEREKKVPGQLVGRGHLEIGVQKFTEPIVIDVLEAENQLLVT